MEILSKLNNIPHRLKIMFDYPENANMESRIYALTELERIGAAGIAFYPVLWLLMGKMFDFDKSHKDLFIAVEIGWILYSSFRLLLHVRFARLIAVGFYRARYIFLLAYFTAIAIFAALLTASLTSSYFSPLRIPMMVCCTGLCAATSLTLAIDPIIRIFTPLLLVGPASIGILASAANRHGQWPLLFLMATFVLFLMISSRNLAKNYWAGLLAKEMLEKQNQTDWLTGIPNRLCFEKTFRRKWQETPNSLGMAVLLIDADYFKNINDTFGHHAGDRFLVAIAAVLTKYFGRESDVFARFGGEEFIAAIDCSNEEEVRALAEQIRHDVARLRIRLSGEDVSITCSIGVALVDRNAFPGSEEKAIRLADECLYKAKKAGRDQIWMTRSKPNDFAIFADIDRPVAVELGSEQELAPKPDPEPEFQPGFQQ